MKKTTITAILGSLLLLTVPAAVQAQFGYMTNADNTLTITNYTGLGGTVNIPTNLNGLTVASIGTNAFAGSRFNPILSVTIPSSVTNIGAEAFENCGRLTNATIANGVVSIGAYAFFFCQSLSSITIPSSVTNWGSYAFQDCGSLQSATIAGNSASIGFWAFEECTKLTNATIANGVVSIGNDAFSGCTSLTTMPYRNSGIDDAYGVLDASFAASVFAEPWPTADRLAQRSLAGPLATLGDGHICNASQGTAHD